MRYIKVNFVMYLLTTKHTSLIKLLKRKLLLYEGATTGAAPVVSTDFGKSDCRHQDGRGGDRPQPVMDVSQAEKNMQACLHVHHQ